MIGIVYNCIKAALATLAQADLSFITWAFCFGAIAGCLKHLKRLANQNHWKSVEVS